MTDEMKAAAMRSVAVDLTKAVKQLLEAAGPAKTVKADVYIPKEQPRIEPTGLRALDM